MFCPNCGSSVEGRAARCPHCGHSLRAGSSLSQGSSSFARPRATDHGSQLATVICSALRGFGPDVFKKPRTLVSYVMDYVPEEDRVGNAFVNNCDEEFLLPFVDALREGTTSAIELAAHKSSEFLCEERSIVERMAFAVAQSVALGIAEYLGVQVSLDVPQREEVPNQPEVTRDRRAIPDAQTDIVGDKSDATQANESRHVEDRKPDTASSGANMAQKPVYCTQCGQPNAPVNTVCTRCGVLLRGGSVQSGSVQPTGKRTSRGIVLTIVVSVLAVAAIALAAYLVFVPYDVDPGSSGNGSTSASTQTSTSSQDVPAQHPAPVFSGAQASSTLRPESDGYTYDASRVLDGDPQTCWAEGSGEELEKQWPNLKGEDYNRALGIGEWLELTSDETQYVSGVKLVSGFNQVRDANTGETQYYHNTRIKGLTITLSDGWSTDFELKDSGPDEWQDISFDGVHPTTSIRITIRSAYDTDGKSGKAEWCDTSLAQVRVY